MLSPQLYQSLVVSLVKHGKMEQRRISGTLYRICTLSELTVMFTFNEDTGKWSADGVNVEIFDIEVFFSSDGDVAITENDEKDEPDVYSITEESLLRVLASFLKWRISVINSLGI